MSAKNVSSFVIVVDASIAHAAGSFESKHPTGIRCRECLAAVRGTGHRLAWNAPIKSEWTSHESAFASSWRAEMFRRGKVTVVPDDSIGEVRAAVATAPTERHSALLKDAHIVEAALNSDHRVLSCDSKACGHWRTVCEAYAPIGIINWVDPTNDHQGANAWLAPTQQGAA